MRAGQSGNPWAEVSSRSFRGAVFATQDSKFKIQELRLSLGNARLSRRKLPSPFDCRLVNDVLRLPYSFFWLLLFIMKIGVVSDTHAYFDPHLPSLLDGVEEILHAGDVGSAAVLDQFRALAPVHAVLGNVDSTELGIPPTLTKTFGGVQIYMLHELPKSPAQVRDWAMAEHLDGKAAEHCRRFLESLPQDCRVVIFGHSHEPCAVVLGGKLFLNPGSAGKKRFSLPRCCARLDISTEGVQATFLGLERYNEDLPESVYLPI